MDALDIVLAALCGVLFAFFLAAGFAAIVHGRLLVPWMVSRVARPRIWGSGILLLAAFLAAQTVSWFHDLPTGASMATLPILFVGLSLTVLAERPPRG
ncbi:hypothetical protein [Streptomyces sp. WG-D5]